MISVVYLFKVKCVLSLPLATDQLLMAEISSCPLLSPVFSQTRQYSLEIRNLIYNLHFFLREGEKKTQQHGNVQLPCVNYSWMSPCSSNFCFFLCILGTAAGLVSTLSRLPRAWATIGLCVLNNYPYHPPRILHK